MTGDLQLKLLNKISEQLETILVSMPREATSSVQIATSARGYDVTVKAYVGSEVRDAGDQAVDEYLRVRSEIERRLMGERAA